MYNLQCQDLADWALVELGPMAEAGHSPTWLRLFRDRESVARFRIQSSEGPDALFGWTAPEDCVGVGVVGTGRAHSLSEEGGGADGPPSPSPRPVRLAYVLARSGEYGWSLEISGRPSRAEPPSGGRMVDVLRRCLGMPTDPPVDPASRLHSAAWLASVLDGTTHATRRLGWADVSRLHPLARLLAGDLATERSADPEDTGRGDDRGGRKGDDLLDLMRIGACVWSWNEIRNQAVAGNLPALVSPERAEWMDDGMFSRWLLAMIPTLDEMMSALRSRLTPSASRRLAHAVRQPTQSNSAVHSPTL